MKRWPNTRLAGRSDSYKMTVKSRNDPALLLLKQMVKDHNKEVRKAYDNLEVTPEYTKNFVTYRVSLRARGPRHDKDGNLLHRSAKQSLKLEYGERFDVYLHEAHDNYQNHRAAINRYSRKDNRLAAKESELFNKVQMAINVIKRKNNDK